MCCESLSLHFALFSCSFAEPQSSHRVFFFRFHFIAMLTIAEHTTRLCFIDFLIFLLFVASKNGLIFSTKITVHFLFRHALKGPPTPISQIKPINRHYTLCACDVVLSEWVDRVVSRNPKKKKQKQKQCRCTSHSSETALELQQQKKT